MQTVMSFVKNGTYQVRCTATDTTGNTHAVTGSILSGIQIVEQK